MFLLARCLRRHLRPLARTERDARMVTTLLPTVFPSCVAELSCFAVSPRFYRGPAHEQWKTTMLPSLVASRARTLARHFRVACAATVPRKCLVRLCYLHLRVSCADLARHLRALRANACFTKGPQSNGPADLILRGGELEDRHGA